MIADFHILNFDNYESYEYDTNYKPIILQINYSKPDENNTRILYNKLSDINFFIHSLNSTCSHFSLPSGYSPTYLHVSGMEDNL